MSFIFVSHASEDKRTLVRPLVEVLIAEGEPVWIDRPGEGNENFGFAQVYIARHNIDHLRSGYSWSGSIQSALRNSGAVLGCLSNALLEYREVILNELAVADSLGKLVTCIVDDLDFQQLPSFSRGLLHADRLQSPRLDPALLRQALDLIQENQCGVEDLPAELSAEWERVRNLIASLDQVRSIPRPLRPPDVARLVPLLRSISIGPILRVDTIPTEIIMAFGDHAGDSARATSLINQANELLKVSEQGSPDARKMLIRPGALPVPGSVGGDVFWTHAFRLAGLIARRTVAALILSPVATWAFRQSGSSDISSEFIERLRQTER